MYNVSSVANGKVRWGGREVGVSNKMAKGDLDDKVTFKQRAEWGGREPRGRCPDLNCNPNPGFPPFLLCQVQQLASERGRR